MRLIIAGDGPDRARLETLAGPRTEFLGRVSESEAARLLSTCAAFMFCADEDFGIAPVEANAHGAPVVGLARGGLLETMQPEVTAEFFAEQTVESVSDAIRRALSRDWDSHALWANAARFSPAIFRAGLLRQIQLAIAGRGTESGAITT
jgi:glycosyltransferase involved in cell wall biosynthesis